MIQINAFLTTSVLDFLANLNVVSTNHFCTLFSILLILAYVVSINTSKQKHKIHNHTEKVKGTGKLIPAFGPVIIYVLKDVVSMKAECNQILSKLAYMNHQNFRHCYAACCSLVLLQPHHPHVLPLQVRWDLRAYQPMSAVNAADWPSVCSKRWFSQPITALYLFGTCSVSWAPWVLFEQVGRLSNGNGAWPGTEETRWEWRWTGLQSHSNRCFTQSYVQKGSP